MYGNAYNQNTNTKVARKPSFVKEFLNSFKNLSIIHKIEMQDLATFMVEFGKMKHGNADIVISVPRNEDVNNLYIPKQ